MIQCRLPLRALHGPSSFPIGKPLGVRPAVRKSKVESEKSASRRSTTHLEGQHEQVNRSYMQSSEEGRGVIEVQLRDVNQLFDSLDPSPFRNRDLSPAAEEYLVESVKEMTTASPCALVVHLDTSTASAGEEHLIGEAIRVHFARRAMLLQRQLGRLMRRGMISLGIGLAFLATFFMIAQLLQHVMGDSPVATLLREGFLIVGWVAMWRPLEIFLYDWWPILGERRLYERLSRIDVRVVSTHLGSKGTSPPVPPGGVADQAIKRETAKALARWEGEGGRVLAADPPRPLRSTET